MEDVKIVDTAGAMVAYSADSSAVYSVKEKPTRVRVPDDKSGKEGKIIPWGEDNLFPQTVLKECRKNTIIGPTIDKQSRIAYEAGLAYGVKMVEDGEVKMVELADDRVEQFLRRSKINRYLMAAYRSFYWFYNVFPEIVLSADRQEIVSIRVQPATYCRWAPQNSNGIVEHCYLHADWEEAGTEAKKATKIRAIDIYDSIASIRDGDDYKYIYPLSYPTEDETFYSLVDWNGLRESGWLDVAQAIPEFKKNLFKNQLNIKYHIEISSYWLNERYPGYDNFSAKKKQTILKQLIKGFEEKMKGNEASGNTILTTFKSDPNFTKEFPGWKINAIDDKVKSGVYIEDSNEASSHLLFALGIDPTLLGSQPGSKLGAGSGSDKRVAFNIYSELIRAHQDLVLEPLNFIAEYNDWRDDEGRLITFWQRNLSNKEEPASRNTMTEQTGSLNEPPQQAK